MTSLPTCPFYLAVYTHSWSKVKKVSARKTSKKESVSEHNTTKKWGLPHSECCDWCVSDSLPIPWHGQCFRTHTHQTRDQAGECINPCLRHRYTQSLPHSIASIKGNKGDWKPRGDPCEQVCPVSELCNASLLWIRAASFPMQGWLNTPPPCSAVRLMGLHASLL